MQTAGERRGNVLWAKITWGIHIAKTQAPYLGASDGRAAHRGIFFSWVREGVSLKGDLGSWFAWMETLILCCLWKKMWDMIPSTQGCLRYLQSEYSQWCQIFKSKGFLKGFSPWSIDQCLIFASLALVLFLPSFSKRQKEGLWFLSASFHYILLSIPDPWMWILIFKF